MDGDAGSLSLAKVAEPVTTFFPDMLEGSLVLSLDPAASSSAATNGVGTVGDGSSGGVIWKVSSASFSSPEGEELGVGVMDWTVFPSAGLLLPGRR